MQSGSQGTQSRAPRMYVKPVTWFWKWNEIDWMTDDYLTASLPCTPAPCAQTWKAPTRSLAKGNTAFAGSAPVPKGQANREPQTPRVMAEEQSRPQPTTDQGPLSAMALPALNPFLVAAEIIKQEYDRSRNRKQRSMKLNYLLPKSPTPIRTAKEIKTYDINVPTTSGFLNARIIAKNLYARQHCIDSSAL